jgi:hypothetical protein
VADEMKVYRYHGRKNDGTPTECVNRIVGGSCVIDGEFWLCDSAEHDDIPTESNLFGGGRFRLRRIYAPTPRLFSFDDVLRVTEAFIESPSSPPRDPGVALPEPSTQGPGAFLR